MASVIDDMVETVIGWRPFSKFYEKEIGMISFTDKKLDDDNNCPTNTLVVQSEREFYTELFRFVYASDLNENIKNNIYNICINHNDICFASTIYFVDNETKIYLKVEITDSIYKEKAIVVVDRFKFKKISNNKLNKYLKPDSLNV